MVRSQVLAFAIGSGSCEAACLTPPVRSAFDFQPSNQRAEDAGSSRIVRVTLACAAAWRRAFRRT
jgi:hypothetical protein